MTLIVLLVVVALAAVFAVAGVAKLVDLAGSREAARGFGVPDGMAGVVGLALPILELVLAVLLVPTATRVGAAVGMLVLLVGFCTVIAIAMARGRAPTCHCFGQLHSEPVGWRTLVRNGVLAAAAAFVAVAGPGVSAVSWFGDLDGVEGLVLALCVVLAALVTIDGYAVVHVLRSYGRVLTRLEAVEERLRAAGFELQEPDAVPQQGLAPGTRAPAFWLPSVQGPRVALGDLLAPGRPLLLVFTSPSCGPCANLMPEVVRWQREHLDEVGVALLSAGEPERVRADAAEHGLANVLLDEGLTAYEAYGANGTPSAVLVGDDGTIAAWLAAGSDWIESLFEEALGGLGRAPGLPVGSELPAVELDRVAGGLASVAALVDRPTVLLFWNPGCGYCRAMHDDLLAWEASTPDGAPALLVVSAGELDEVRAEGFRSEVLLDPQWSLSGEIGANGTPMAMVVDGDGRVASPLVSGGVDALSLLGVRELSPAE